MLKFFANFTPTARAAKKAANQEAYLKEANRLATQIIAYTVNRIENPLTTPVSGAELDFLHRREEFFRNLAALQ